MIGSSRFHLMLALSLIVMGIPANLEAQFGALVRPSQAAQARSQEELDAYLEIVSAKDAHEVVRKVNVFASQFPKSELLSGAYQYQLQAFRRIDDLDGMLLAGGKALIGNSDDLSILLILAPAMANRAAERPDRVELLSRAESYAHQALDGIEKVRIPHTVSIEQWKVQKIQMQSEAHGVLGVVAFQRGHVQKAISELEIAINLSPMPQGVQFLRLGLALAAAGKKNDADQKLRRAAELGPGPVHDLALDELKKLTRMDPTRR